MKAKKFICMQFSAEIANSPHAIYYDKETILKEILYDIFDFARLYNMFVLINFNVAIPPENISSFIAFLFILLRIIELLK